MHYPFRILIVKHPNGDKECRVVYQSGDPQLDFGDYGIACCNVPESTSVRLYLRGNQYYANHKRFRLNTAMPLSIDELNTKIKNAYPKQQHENQTN